MNSSNLKIVEQEFSSFFEVPFQVYEPDFPFVSEFRDDLKRFLSTKNPIFKDPKNFTYYTALREQRPVGRIVCHIHEASNLKYGWKKSYFGYFDLENNVETARALLQKAEEFGRKHGCTEVVGNFNLTAMQKAGVVTEFYKNVSYSDLIVNPLYVPELLKKCGYEATFPMKTFEIDISKLNYEDFIGPKQQGLLASGEYTFHHMNKKNVAECLDIMRLCLNDGMENNPWFVALTKEEIEFQAKDLMLVIDEKISIFAKHKGEPVGAMIVIPNLNPFLKNIKSRLGLTTPYYFLKHKLYCDTAIIIFYSVFRKFHSIGINSLLMAEAVKNLKERGYKTMGGTWIADDNVASLKSAAKLKAYPIHRTHLFRKELA